MNSQKQSGMTLVEMTTVLLVLVTLSAIVVPYVVGTGYVASCQATDATLIAVKEAIMGGKSGPGYYNDLPSQLPRDKGARTQDGKKIYSLHYLMVRDDQVDNDEDGHMPSNDGETDVDDDDEWRRFNVRTLVGWRGPYLLNAGTLPTEAFQNNDINDQAQEDVRKASFQSPERVHVDHTLSDQRYILDAWGRPIVLQVPDDDNVNGNLNCGNQLCARIVSAGPNGLLETPLTANDENNNHYESAETRNDDRVLFLRIADPHPAGNQECQ